MRFVLLLALVMATGGCIFDSSGADSEGPYREGGGSDSALDRGVTGKDPDVGDAAPLDRPLPDLGKLDQPAPQGKTCAGARVAFTASAVPKACGSIGLKVSGSQAFVWVLAGVSASGESKPAKWAAGATAKKCSAGYCWEFAKVPVPCTKGPYRFHFMRNATNNDPFKGQEVGACQP